MKSGIRLTIHNKQCGKLMLKIMLLSILGLSLWYNNEVFEEGPRAQTQLGITGYIHNRHSNQICGMDNCNHDMFCNAVFTICNCCYHHNLYDFCCVVFSLQIIPSNPQYNLRSLTSRAVPRTVPAPKSSPDVGTRDTPYMSHRADTDVGSGSGSPEGGVFLTSQFCQCLDNILIENNLYFEYTIYSVECIDYSTSLNTSGKSTTSVHHSGDDHN